MLKLWSARLVLRDIESRDVEDFVRWYTIDTEWMNWDAPWETSDDIDVEAVRQFYGKRVAATTTGTRHRFQMETTQGEHIGWVTSYRMPDEHPAIGIDIPNPVFRNRGFGRLAYQMFLQYLLSEGHEKIYTQTWSGNLPMIRLAEKVGFIEVDRQVNQREVKGALYDGLTFLLEVPRFCRSLLPDKTWMMTDEVNPPEITMKPL